MARGRRYYTGLGPFRPLDPSKMVVPLHHAARSSGQKSLASRLFRNQITRAGARRLIRRAGGLSRWRRDARGRFA